MAQSKEYTTLVNQRGKLRLALMSDRNAVDFFWKERFIAPNVFDNLTYSKSSFTEQEKASMFVDEISRKVELEAQNYYKLLDYLQQGGKRYQDIVKILDHEYSSLVKQKVEPSKSKGTSSVFTSKSLPDSVISAGLPQDDWLLSSKNDVRHAISDIKSTFAIFINKVQAVLQQERVEAPQLISLFVSYDSSFKDVLAEAKTVPEVFIAMGKYWSFQDYDLVRPIIKRYKKHLQSLYTSYRGKLSKFFQEFVERRICECPQDLFGDRDEDDIVLIVKTGMSVHDKIKELSGIIKEVKGMFGSKALQLLSVVHEGGVQLIFRTSPQSKKEEFIVSGKQQLTLQNLNVLSLSFKDQLVYDLNNPRTSSSLPGGDLMHSEIVSHCQHKEQKKDYPVGDEFRAIHKEIVETGSLAKRTESGSVEATHNEEGLNEESKNRINPPFALKTEFSSPDVKKCLPVKKNADKELDASSPVPLGPHDLTQLEEPLPMMESCSKDAGLVNKSVETNATSGAESSELAEPDAIEPSKHVEVQNRESHKDNSGSSNSPTLPLMDSDNDMENVTTQQKETKISDEFQVFEDLGEEKLKATSRTANTNLIDEIANGSLELVKRLIAEGHNPYAFEISALHAAALYGKLDILKYLIEEEGYNPAPEGKYGRTPLHLAAEAQHPHIIEYLVSKQQMDPFCLDREGCTPLHVACENGDLASVMCLFKSMETYMPTEKIFKECNQDKYSPIHLAASCGHIDVLKYFIEVKQCNPSLPNPRNGFPPICCAANHGHLPIVKYLAEERGCNILQSLQMSLTVAAMGGHLSVVKYLTQEMKINPLLGDPSNCTPFHWAVWKGHIDVVDYYISVLKCDPNLPAENEQTPVHITAQGGHLALLQHLAENHNCDLLKQDKFNQTPVHLAAASGHLHIIQYLCLDKNCNIISRNRSNNTPLHVAALGGHADVVEFFLTILQWSPEIYGPLGRMPLHHASQEGHLQVVRKLIEEHHCNPSSPDEHGITPLQMAIRAGHLTVVQYLTQVPGCDLNVCADNSDTLLHTAVKFHRLDIVKFLVEDLKFPTDMIGVDSLTPLEVALNENCSEFAEYLLSKKATV